MKRLLTLLVTSAFLVSSCSDRNSGASVPEHLDGKRMVEITDDQIMWCEEVGEYIKTASELGTFVIQINGHTFVPPVDHPKPDWETVASLDPTLPEVGLRLEEEIRKLEGRQHRVLCELRGSDSAEIFFGILDAIRNTGFQAQINGSLELDADAERVLKLLVWPGSSPAKHRD